MRLTIPFHLRVQILSSNRQWWTFLKHPPSISPPSVFPRFLCRAPQPPPSPTSSLLSVAKGKGRGKGLYTTRTFLNNHQWATPSSLPPSSLYFGFLCSLSLSPCLDVEQHPSSSIQPHSISSSPFTLHCSFPNKRVLFLPPGPHPPAVSLPYPLSNPSQLFRFKCPLLFPVIKANKIKPGALLYVIPKCCRFLEMQGPKPYQPS